MIWNYFSLFQEVSSVSSGFNMFGWINSTNMMLIDLKNLESTDLGGSLISLFATVVLYGFSLSGGAGFFPATVAPK